MRKTYFPIAPRVAGAEANFPLIALAERIFPRTNKCHGECHGQDRLINHFGKTSRRAIVGRREWSNPNMLQSVAECCSGSLEMPTFPFLPAPREAAVEDRSNFFAHAVEEARLAVCDRDGERKMANPNKTNMRMCDVLFAF